MKAIAKIEGVTKTYGIKDAKVTALDNVSVEIQNKELTAIMGPSGSGKSTLMHCMAGLDRADSGKIRIGNKLGFEITKMTQTQLTKLRRHEIGFIFQKFNLIPNLTAKENILLPLQIAHKKINHSWYEKLVELTNLKDRLNHKPSELSGGQQQRVACARAFITKPSIVFADEPTGNLDSKSSNEILKFIRLYVDEMGQAITMVTHDPVTASFAHRVLVLSDGKITKDIQSPTQEAIRTLLV
jgi:putative ABC transport system ATP-binding protein